MSQRVLYQFPISHYCEKARWVLDYKRVPYRIHNQLPGLHMRTNKRLTGSSTVPLLRDGAAAISGSQAIALHLESQHGTPSLLPRSAAGRRLHDQLVRHIDDVVGPAVRQYLYRNLLPHTELFREAFFREYGALPRLVGGLFAGPLTKVIGKTYNVRSQEAAGLPDLLRREADRLESLLRDGSPYLIDGAFTLADITVASLFGPLVGPAGSPWSAELQLPEVEALRAELRQRPLGQYMMARYAERFA